MTEVARFRTRIGDGHRRAGAQFLRVGERRGHILDAHTLALWRFSDALAHTTGSPVVDAQGTSWTNADASTPIPGITEYTPIPSMYARKFSCEPTRLVATGGAGTMISRATSLAAQNAWKGSWAVEAFLRMDTTTVYGDWILGHIGTNGASEAENCLGVLGVQSTGKLFVLWAHGVGIDDVIVQSAGSGVITGQWHHVCAVKDSPAKVVRFYIDGVLQETVAYVSEPTGGTSGLWIIGGVSRTSTSGTRSDFSCRTVRFWSGPLFTETPTLAEIQANAARLTTHGTLVAPSFVVGTAPGHDFSAAPASLDSSGNGYHLISAPAGGAVTTYACSVGGMHGTTDASTRYIPSGGALGSFFDAQLRSALEGECTVEMWIQPVPPGGARGLFHWGTRGITEGDAWNYMTGQVTATAAVRFEWEATGGSANQTIQTADNLVGYGARYHIGCRKRSLGGGLWAGAIFINGVLQVETGGLQNYTAGSLVAEGGFQLGVSTSAINNFLGLLGDTRVSSVARTDQQILESYERGIGAQ